MYVHLRVSMKASDLETRLRMELVSPMIILSLRSGVWHGSIKDHDYFGWDLPFSIIG